MQFNKIGLRPKEDMTGNSELLYFESCNTSWCFDQQSRRFKRIPRPTGRQASATDFAVVKWEEYFALNFNDGSDEFTVALNSEESKLLRSWRHSDNCTHCFGDEAAYSTEEISVSELSHLLEN